MKKASLIIVVLLLITGASSSYGYFFIYEADDSEPEIVEQEEPVTETNDTIEEEPDDPPLETNDTFFRGIKDECFEHGGMDRCWKLYVPDETDETQSIPLILDIHGLERNADNQYEMTDMDRIARENNAIIIYPQGYGNSWNFRACCDPAKEEGIDDIGFLRSLVTYQLDIFPIDSDRIYLTGWSNGCAMSQVLANEASDMFTAVACMSMYFIGDKDPSYSPIPVMEIHGFLDPVAIYSHVAATSFFFQQVFWNTGAIQNLYTWRDMNECSGILPDRNEESLYYNIQGFTDCKNDAEVALVTIHLGTHNVYAKDDPVSSEPGTQGTIDTAQIAWDFMSKHSK